MNRIKLITLVNKILPKQRNKIVFYGRTSYDNNHHALIKYLIKKGYNEKYRIYLVVANDNDLIYYDNIKHIKRVKDIIAGAYHTLTAKYIFHTHGMGKMANNTPNNQMVFDMWHGTALKTLGEYSSNYHKRSTKILATCEFSKEYFKKCFGYKEDQFFICGYPRCEQFFEENHAMEQLGILKENYDKIVLYMPTFRKASRWDRNDSDHEFPLFNEVSLEEFNVFLSEKNIMFIIKPHPAQDNLDIFNLDFSNIKIIKNDFLLSKKIMPYNFVGETDILITDYSSIYFDFLLTQKPIGFVIDDIDDYSDKRGFVVDNPLDYMPGEKIKDVEELKAFLDSILAGKDDWKEKRKEINDLVNFDQSLEYSKKILDFVGITKE